MLVLGLKSTLLLSEVVEGIRCPACDAEKSIKIEISGYYFQVYWLPFFPFQKGCVASCQSCKWQKFDKQMPAALLAKSKELRVKARYPKWYYGGWVILGLLIWFSVWAIKDGNKNDLVYLNAPQVGDRYEMATDTFTYTYLKVIALNGDTVKVIANQQVTESVFAVDTLDQPRFYNGKEAQYSKQALLKMHEDDHLLRVHR